MSDEFPNVAAREDVCWACAGKKWVDIEHPGEHPHRGGCPKCSPEQILTASEVIRRHEEIRGYIGLLKEASEKMIKDMDESTFKSLFPKPRGFTKGLDDEKGTKFDDGKTPLNLLSSKWLLGVGEVLKFGAKKYEAHNWRRGIASSRLIDAASRHLLAFNDGEDNDPETGLSHLLHASCCLMFLYELSQTKPELDDRYRRHE